MVFPEDNPGVDFAIARGIGVVAVVIILADAFGHPWVATPVGADRDGEPFVDDFFCNGHFDVRPGGIAAIYADDCGVGGEGATGSGRLILDGAGFDQGSDVKWVIAEEGRVESKGVLEIGDRIAGDQGIGSNIIRIEVDDPAGGELEGIVDAVETAAGKPGEIGDIGLVKG